MRRTITQILLFNGVSQVPLHRTRITLHDFLLKSTAKIRHFCDVAKFIFFRGCERREPPNPLGDSSIFLIVVCCGFIRR